MFFISSCRHHFYAEVVEQEQRCAKLARSNRYILFARIYFKGSLSTRQKSVSARVRTAQSGFFNLKNGLCILRENTLQWSSPTLNKIHIRG
jgi:hypothetical protein